VHTAPGVELLALTWPDVDLEEGRLPVRRTLDIYSHVAPHMQSDAAERIDAGMRAALGGS